MGNREPSALRRTMREEVRIWPAALVLVVIYLLVEGWREDSPEAMTEAPPGLGAWNMTGGDQ